MGQCSITGCEDHSKKKYAAMVSECGISSCQASSCIDKWTQPGFSTVHVGMPEAGPGFITGEGGAARSDEGVGYEDLVYPFTPKGAEAQLREKESKSPIKEDAGYTVIDTTDTGSSSYMRMGTTSSTYSIPSESTTPTSAQTEDKQKDKKQNMKATVNEFRAEAKDGIPCTLYGVDGATWPKTSATMLLHKEKKAVVTLVPVEDSEKTKELELGKVTVFDYGTLKKQHPEHKALAALQAKDDQKLCVLLVSEEETVCILLNDEAMKTKSVLSLRLLSEFARSAKAPRGVAAGS